MNVAAGQQCAAEGSAPRASGDGVRKCYAFFAEAVEVWRGQIGVAHVAMAWARCWSPKTQIMFGFRGILLSIDPAFRGYAFADQMGV